MVVVLAPYEYLPWYGLVHRWGGGLAAPALASLIFLFAAWLLPPPSDEPTLRRDGVALALGLLLIIEPIMHLGALWWSAQAPSLAVAEAILPAPGSGSRVSTWLLWLEIVVLAPLAEEWFFRGRLLPWLVRRLGTVHAVSITTLVFAAAHLQPMQVVIAVPLGLMLAWLRLNGGGVMGCVIAHAAHNLMFLVLGSALIGHPAMAPVLIVSGLVMVALAWLHLTRPVLPLRYVMAALLVVLGAGAVALLQPLHRRWQDRWWTDAAHLLVVFWRIDNNDILARLDDRLRVGVLTTGRRQVLAAHVRLRPCQTLPRQRLLLATLDPAGFVAAVDDHEAESVLEDLAWGLRSPIRDQVARDIGQRQSAAFARVASNDSRPLRRWLPLPAQAQWTARQLVLTTNPLLHRALLNALEQAHPGQIVNVLFHLRATEVTANDRRHLWARYPDARQRLVALAVKNPALARAFALDGSSQP